MHCHTSCTCSVQALVSGEVSPCERHFGQKHQHVSIFVVVLGRWVLFSLVWSPTRRFSCRLCLCNLLFLSNVDVCHLFHSASFAESPVVSMIHVISVRQRANSITALTWELTVSCSELLQHLLLLVTLAQKVRRASRQISKTLNRSSCFPLCFQTKIPLFVCAERHSQHTHTNTHTHTQLAEDPRASGTRIRSHDREMEEGLLCQPRFRFPASVCLHELERWRRRRRKDWAGLNELAWSSAPLLENNKRGSKQTKSWETAQVKLLQTDCRWSDTTRS